MYLLPVSKLTLAQTCPVSGGMPCFTIAKSSGTNRKCTNYNFAPEEYTIKFIKFENGLY